MKHRKEIKKITDRIIKKYKPEKIILFGSYAWGKPTEDSDVDLFLIKNTKKTFHQRQITVREIIDGEIAADILVYTPMEFKKRFNLGDFFIKNIVKKGKLLYENSEK